MSTEKKRGDVASSWKMWVGLGLFWSWLWVVLIKPDDIALPSPSGASLLADRMLTLASMVAMLGIVMMARRRSQPRIILTHLPVALSAAYAVAALLPSLPLFSFQFLEPVTMVVKGALLACLFASWMTIISPRGTEFSASCCTRALIVSTACMVVVHLLDFSKQEVLLVAVPLCSTALLCASAPNSVAAADPAVSAPRKPWRLFWTIAVQGFALGVWHFLFSIIVLEKCPAEFCVLRELNSLFTTHGLADFIGFASILGFVGACALIVVTINVLSLNFRRLIYQVGLPFMALGFVVIAFDRGIIIQNGTHITGDIFIAGEIIHAAGYFYILALVQVLCAYLVKERGADSLELSCFVGFSLMAGQIVGFVAAGVANSFGISGTDLCMFTVFVLLSGGLLLITGDRVWNDVGEARPVVPDEIRDGFSAACDELATAAALTPRETEVVALLAKGRNLRFIEGELFISRDTVKSHLRNIYRKLDIHSQQELIDLVEEQAKATGNGRKPKAPPRSIAKG